LTPSLALVATIVVLTAAGVYLVLERSLTRILLGIIMIGNAANLLFLVSGGRAGGAPIIGHGPPEEMSDPLPQAMVLTAIVITLGMTAFVLTMSYRSWQLNGHDEVRDDVEDRRVARRAAQLEAEVEIGLEEQAAQAHDETVLDEELPPDREPGERGGQS
jgi:multicomponent Na+:H+ antiporter subunit C